MKIIIIGANGTVGRTAVEALSSRHEIIAVGKTSGDIQADIEDLDSVRSMYQKVGKVDAVVSTVGHGYFGAVNEMTTEQFMKGINHKVLPQVNLVLEGFNYINDGGSFTLTSGVLNRDPIPEALVLPLRMVPSMVLWWVLRLICLEVFALMRLALKCWKLPVKNMMGFSEDT